MLQYKIKCYEENEEQEILFEINASVHRLQTLLNSLEIEEEIMSETQILHRKVIDKGKGMKQSVAVDAPIFVGEFSIYSKD